MKRRLYCTISAAFFCIVTVAHATPFADGWFVTVDSVTIPMLVSWLGSIGLACLAVWGSCAARRDN
jgi:hypothetical protein